MQKFIVCPLCNLCMRFVRGRHVARNNARSVHHYEVFNAHVQEVFADRNARRARAVYYDFYFADILFYDFKRVQKRSRNDDCRAVLVVVEHGNVAFFLEFLFNLKAPRRGDVL